MGLLKIILFILLGLIGLIVTLLVIALFRTLLLTKKVASYEPKSMPDRERKYAELLSKMVQQDTTSVKDEDRSEIFRDFHLVLEKLFPRVWQDLEVTEIDGNLLIHWPGKDSDRPLILMSHQDVVPAEGKWKYPPFAGTIAEGKVWGRGTADTKCSLMALLQACEELLEAGYQPDQDVYLASSCTEEWRGDGAPKLVAELERRGVSPYLAVDEGGGIIDTPIAGISGLYAMVGVFEKGQGDLKFTAKSQGGHASAPNRNTPLSRLAAFVNHIEKKNPFAKRFLPEASAMFETLAPYANFGMRYIFSNLWLFGPLLKKVFPYISAQAAAMLQTTMAFTMAEGSDTPNVLPQEASVTANIRYIPHQGEQESLEILEDLSEKYDLEMEVLSSSDSSKVANIEGDAFKLLEQVVSETYPGITLSPYAVTAGTDVKFFEKICDTCLRFSPVIFGQEQLAGIHGIDENIEMRSLPGAVDFYKNIIKANK